MNSQSNHKKYRYHHVLIQCVCWTIISACNSGGSNSTPVAGTNTTGGLSVTDDNIASNTPVLTQAIVDLPTDNQATGGAGLIIKTMGDCATTGEMITLTLLSNSADVGLVPSTDSAQNGNNVTAYTEFSLDADSASSQVDVISHTDSQLNLIIPSPDIVSITASFADNSVTDFIAAWPSDAPESAVLIAERDNGVCLYSMRLPGFCGTTRSSGATSQMFFGGHVLEFSGCMINQTPDLPVLRVN